MTFKTFTLAAALAATAFATTAPAFAENTVSESRAKIERILDSREASAPARQTAPKASAKAEVMSQDIELPNRVDLAKIRLFGTSYGSSDGR